jgi:hypothetical protein
MSAGDNDGANGIRCALEITEADSWQRYLTFHGVETNPDGTLNLPAAIDAGANALWPHYLAVRDGLDRELTIAFLELLLSRTLKQSPHMTDQQQTFSELLRRSGDRVIFQRATGNPGANLSSMTVSVLESIVRAEQVGRSVASGNEP